jgi:hypothetical protein
MVEKYRYYGMTWNFPTYVKSRGYRYKFGGAHDGARLARVNITEMKFSGKAGILRAFTKKNRSGREYKLYVIYYRNTGKQPKLKPFDWNDPENKRRYNLK